DRGQRGVRRVLLHQLTVAVDPALVVDVLRLEPLQVRGPLGQLRLEGAFAGRRVGDRRSGVLDLGLVRHLGRRVGGGAHRGDGLLPVGEAIVAGRLGHEAAWLSSPSLPGSSTISASTTSSSDSPVAPVVPPAAAESASAAAYIAAPIFWLDSPSLVTPELISS